MALTLVAHIAGQRTAEAIQLGIEYHPEPPFDAGSPEKVDANLREAVQKRLLTAFEINNQISQFLER